jgi:hypothetical protein
MTLGILGESVVGVTEGCSTPAYMNSQDNFDAGNNMLTTTYVLHSSKSAEDSKSAILCAYLSPATIFDPVLDVELSLSLSRSLTQIRRKKSNDRVLRFQLNSFRRFVQLSLTFSFSLSLRHHYCHLRSIALDCCEGDVHVKGVSPLFATRLTTQKTKLTTQKVLGVFQRSVYNS